MRSECQPSAKQRGWNIDARIHMICSRISDDRTRRNAYKRMHHIPNAIDIRYLVGKKFDKIKAASNADDPPAIKDIKTARQLCRSELFQKSKNSYRRVKIDPRGPRRTECQT